MTRFGIVVTFFLSAIAACSSSNEGLLFSQHVKLNEHSPRGLLAIMDKEGQGHIFILERRVDWVKKSDISFLVQEMESDSGSMSVSLLASSFMDDGRSTVGAEAYFMLLGYKHGVYPPALNSTKHQLESRAELLSWLESERP